LRIAPVWTFCALLLFALAGCGGTSAMRGWSASATAALDRQILVMLKDWPLRRYQPGGSQSPYSDSMPVQQERLAARLAQEYDLQLLSQWPMPALGVRCFLAAVPAADTREQIVSRLASDRRVESVQSVQPFHTLAHNDPYYSLQTNAAILRLNDLHRMSRGRNILIAQIDTAVEIEHPDLGGQLSRPVDFVNDGRRATEFHGTAVAGIIVAKADNNAGIVGVAPEAKLLPLRACWQVASEGSDALCTSFTLAKAIQYALSNDARVLNLSLAGPPDPLLARLIDKAIARGTIVVSALDPVQTQAGFPASHDGVIAVGAADTLSVSARVVYAPGENVLTTVPKASWAFVSGNSFATAQVTGIVALLLERAPELNPHDILVLLQRQGGRDAGMGRGSLLDACSLLASVSPKGECRCCEASARPGIRKVGDKGS
jgi:subtilisin family serine protease